MGNNPVLVVVAVVILAVAIVLIAWNMGGNPPPPQGSRSFYDEGTKELYPFAKQEWPPVKAPSGQDGVKAFVYSCTDCEDKSSRFIGYLQKFTPEGKENLLKAFKENDMNARVIEFERALVRVPDEAQWYEKNTAEGVEIRDAIHDNCAEGEVAEECKWYLE